jgi:hypothetical protein
MFLHEYPYATEQYIINNTKCIYVGSFLSLFWLCVEAVKLLFQILEFFRFPQITMARKKTLVASKKRKMWKTQLLDLPNQTIDCILKRLSLEELCKVSKVCTYLRNQSSNDYLWKKHVQHKWSKLVGDVVHQVWQWHRTKIKYATRSFSLHQDVMDTCAAFRGTWPYVGIQPYLENNWPYINLIKNYSHKVLYACLETCCFWFPAQLYRVRLVSIW